MGPSTRRRRAGHRAGGPVHQAALLTPPPPRRRAPEPGELSAHADPEQLAATAVAFTHGLVVQTLFDPGRFPEDSQVTLLDRLLASLVRS
ncbi:TetR family transcriptional regulator C-terminal domain-containing protein [Streptomyces griseoluteus]|uniref:TetR family transcriptional regulator C-terminal domain-containing protein n=1 Tax=Streptomyces griseoluteus TaxID=29306 RepID=UPI0036AC6AA7